MKSAPGKHLLQGGVLVLLTVLLLTAAFPGFDQWYLSWISLVPLLFVINRNGAGASFLLSFLAGWGFYSLHMWWFWHVESVGPGAFLACGSGTAIFYGLFGLGAWFFNRTTPRFNIITLPALWVLMEYVKTHSGFLSVPWGTLAYSQYRALPVAKIASFSGIYGVSYVIVVVNCLVAGILLSKFSPRTPKCRLPGRSTILFGILVPLVFLAFASITFPRGERTVGLNVAAIQGNTTLSSYSDFETRKIVWERYRDLTLQARGVGADLIAWPSSSVPGAIPWDSRLVGMIGDLAKQVDAHLLVGTSGYEKFNRRKGSRVRLGNSASLFSPEGRYIKKYDKILLLPFDEYYPLRGKIKWPHWVVDPKMEDTRVGEELTIFSVDDTSFGVQICWENFFPEQFREIVAKGVDFMVCMTNESAASHPHAHYYTMAINAFRAVENHVSILRTAPTGVSAIIGPDGRILSRLRDKEGQDVNIQGILYGNLPLTNERTIYSRVGDLFVVILLIIVVVFLGTSFYSLTRPGS